LETVGASEGALSVGVTVSTRVLTTTSPYTAGTSDDPLASLDNMG